ncbi:MAG: LacI family DNA-binding transcriptional regulator [Pseudomonadota bacterium]
MPEKTISDNDIPTLKDVALYAGVSTATVSRCLNAPNRVSARTRESVMAAVNALGYAPNFSAQALAAKRTNTFGAIVPTMRNAIFAEGLQAFQEELGAHGITLLVASSSYRADLEAEQIRALVARGADGLLLIGHDRDPETYVFLEKRQIPYVVTWAHRAGSGRTSIGFDNARAMANLTREVIALGHRNLALIAGERDRNDRARDRAKGVTQAMRANGLDPERLITLETPYIADAGARAFAQVLEHASPPTAVLCGNDVIAAGALRQAQKMGLRVPQDISITGFDDIELAGLLHPGLTTVAVPHRDMGRGAARALFDLCAGHPPGREVELDASITWRASLGPAPGPPR